MTMRVAIVGGGFIGLRHASAIAAVEDVELAGVATRSSDSLDKFTDQYSVWGTTDYRELIGAEVDVILVATPHHLHTDIAVQAANAGKHVMLEKPMALSLDECDRIIDAVEAAEVQMMVGFTYRFSPHYLVAKDIIDSGQLGRPVLGTTTVIKGWWAPNRRDWHLDRKTGGGMWLVAGIHGLDRLSWLLDGMPKSVSAQFQTNFHQMSADDTGAAFFRYSNGRVATVVSIGYRSGVVSHRTEITLTDGVLVVDDRKGVWVGRDEEWTEIDYNRSQPWPDIAFRNQWQEFRDGILNQTQVQPDGRSGRETMAAVFAAEESSSQGAEIAIAHRSESP